MLSRTQTLILVIHRCGGSNIALSSLTWANALCQVVLIQPSSAAAERACSLLNSSFVVNQEFAIAGV